MVKTTADCLLSKQDKRVIAYYMNHIIPFIFLQYRQEGKQMICLYKAETGLTTYHMNHIIHFISSHMAQPLRLRLLLIQGGN